MDGAHRPIVGGTVYSHPKNNLLNNRVFYIVLLAFHAIIWWFAHSLPFLGDSLPSNLYAAENIYNHNLLTVWNTPQADPGHPTLYPFIIALFWTVLGKSLWVTHLVQVLGGFCLIIVLHKITLRYFSTFTARFAALLVAISPLYVGQLFTASLQLPLVLLAFASFYYWQQQRYRTYTLLLCLMMLCHLQGAFLLLFLCLNDALAAWITGGKKSILPWLYSRWWVYSLPFLVFATWGMAHYMYFGWAFSSPNYLREAPGLKGILYNIGIAAWRIADFGYIVPLLATLVYFMRRRKAFYLGEATTSILLTYVLQLAVVGGGICLLFAYPPIHRYFLMAAILLLVLFAGILQNMKPTARTVWAVLSCAALVAGNFMYYPGKCLGDANLSYLPVFELEQKLVSDFAEGTEFYTYAPLSYPTAKRYLDSSKGPVFKELYNIPIDSAAYIVQSNMNCEFTGEELKHVENWYATSYEKGGIYINVYANPAKVPLPTGWKLRTPTKAEQWLQGLKNKMR